MKVVIFDMDGTLIDSQKDITISVNHVRYEEYGLEPLEMQFIVDAINMEVRNLPKLFYNTQSYEERARQRFEAHYYEQCIKNPYLYEGIKEVLSTLRTNDIKLSVATNAPTMFAQRMLGHLGVADMFDLIVGADKVSASKPDPKMLLEILKHYDFNHADHQAWMVGDNSKDILSADAAGIDSLFATWGFTPQAKHHTVLQHPKEILDIVL